MKTRMAAVVAVGVLVVLGAGALVSRHFSQTQPPPLGEGPPVLARPTPNAATIMLRQDGPVFVITVFGSEGLRRGVARVQRIDTPDFSPVVRLVKATGEQTCAFDVAPEIRHADFVGLMSALHDAGFTLGSISLGSE